MEIVWIKRIKFLKIVVGTPYKKQSIFLFSYPEFISEEGYKKKNPRSAYQFHAFVSGVVVVAIYISLSEISCVRMVGHQ